MNSAFANVKTITKRELTAYFASPVAYVFIVIFLLLAGFFTFNAGYFFERNQANLDSFFQWHPWLYLFLVPAVRRAPHGNHGTSPDHAHHRVAGDSRQVPRLVGVSCARTVLHFPRGDNS